MKCMCGETKETEFYKANKSKCKTCLKKYNKERLQSPEIKKRQLEKQKNWRQDPKNKEAKKRKDRDCYLKRTHNISLDKFEAILYIQGGGCAICGSNFPGRNSFHVDHDHFCCPGEKTCGNCVRGLLCENCNHGLGNLKDDVKILKKAIEYLETRGVISRT